MEKKHYFLFYDYSPDYMERRPQFRGEHLKLARDAHARGELILGGALTNPPDRGILLFLGESPAAAEAFAEVDPYVRNGLVEKWEVREWYTVIGDDAAYPVKE